MLLAAAQAPDEHALLEKLTAANALAYCDGACPGNGKGDTPGGWGVLMVMEGKLLTAQGGARDTTNNKMELLAVISALEAVAPGCALEVRTDSQYVVNGSTIWRRGWQAKGMKTAGGKPVANADLWHRLWAAADARKVKFTWVRGHNGDPGNEVADRLSVLGTP